MIYTEDRATFERDMFRPPFMARLLDIAGRYAHCPAGRISADDKEELYKLALDKFWELRDTVRFSNDVYRVWENALKAAAATREKWLVWSQVQLAYVWVRANQLGKR